MKKASNFEKMVWAQIELIPYGKTRSYKDIAQAIGNPKAYRAVANACGKNPIPIIRKRSIPIPISIVLIISAKQLGLQNKGTLPLLFLLNTFSNLVYHL